MPADIATARDDIIGVFKVKWDADTPAVNGGAIPKVFYEGVGEATDKPENAAWARIQVRHVSGSPVSLGTIPNATRTTKVGIVTVEIYTPLSLGLGLVLNENLAQIAKDAFDVVTTTNGVIFRTASANEIGVDDQWFQTNVVADWEYDEFI